MSSEYSPLSTPILPDEISNQAGVWRQPLEADTLGTLIADAHSLVAGWPLPGEKLAVTEALRQDTLSILESSHHAIKQASGESYTFEQILLTGRLLDMCKANDTLRNENTISVREYDRRETRTKDAAQLAVAAINLTALDPDNYYG